MPVRALLATGAVLATAAAPALAGDAVTMQLDARHTGGTRDGSLKPPLQRVWQRRFEHPPTYPLVVGERVYAAVRSASLRRPAARVLAFSARTGHTIWRRDLDADGPATLAYGSGRVYALTAGGDVAALDARTGKPVWERPADLFGTTGPPVAFGGDLYVVRSSYVQAFDGETGNVLWSTLIDGTASTGPVVTADRVYASFAGPQVYALDRQTGAVIWHPYESVHGGGGETPALYRGRLYVRYGRGHVFAADDGSTLGEFRVQDYVEPAFAFGTGYILDELRREYAWHDAGDLVALGLRGLRPRWRFQGDGYLQSPPLVVNRTVYVGSATGRLYGVDARTGRLRWRTHLPEGVSGDGFSHGKRALAAGRGLLVVPATNRLVAFR